MEGFDFGAPGIASGLTGTLAPLKLYKALRIPVEHFEEAMQRLRQSRPKNRAYANVDR